MFSQYYILSLIVAVSVEVIKGQNSPRCRVYPIDNEIPSKIVSHGNEGANLLKYEISFADYSENPLEVNITHAYQADQWHKVYNRQGQVLLSLTFNYDVLSLSLLQFGVVNLNIELQDNPKGCFGALNETEKVDHLMALLLADFQQDNNSDPAMSEEEFTCHQVLEVADGGEDVRFSDECCQVSKDSGQVKCHTQGPIPTISIIYYFLVVIKIAFLLYGPLALQSWVSRDSLKRPTYIVPLTDTIDTSVNCFRFNKYIPRSKVHADMAENQKMRFEKLHISVDNHALMSEKSVPVGLFRFLIDNFLKCKITRTEPFNSCCSQSLIGSWSRYFLCIPLRREEPRLNAGCKKCLSWRHIFVFIGSVLTLGFVSLPFVFRLTIFYVYEHSEIESRRRAVNALGYDLARSHNTFQTIAPTDGLLIFGYICYFVSFLVIALFRKFCPDKFGSVLFPALQDLTEVSYIEAVRMVFAHLILPIEKFGVVGFLIGLVYWPIAIPLCIIALICYCVPILYLTGRFLIHQRPAFLDKGAKPTSAEDVNDPDVKRKMKHSLTCGAKSIDTILKLNNISPADPDPELADILMENKALADVKTFCNDTLIPILIGIVCIINMYALITIYAEVIGFVAEIIVLTLMGAIINASMAHKYIMLCFWILMYTVNCYNQVYENYFKLNQKLFSYMKSKLDSQVMAVTLQKATMQKNTAFKYFSRAEVRHMCDKYPDFLDDACCSTASDKLYRCKEKLLWNIRSLVLFVDKNDVARIPRKLFFGICEEELEGCPGPVYKSLAHATRNLLYMVIFLIFVFLIIMAYGSIYSVSSTNQLLLTLAGGFLPSIIRFVIQPNVKISVNLNTYTFHGRIQQMLYEYTQKWPVAVLNGDFVGEVSGGDSNENMTGPENYVVEHEDDGSHLHHM